MSAKNQTEVKKISQYNTLSTAIILLALISAVYTLFYSGTFLTDDEHILASRALSLAFDNSLNDARIMGNSRVFAYSQFAPQQSLEALNIEPAQTFFGAILVKLSVALGVGRIQTLFEFNIWVTALTGVLLYITAIRLGYSRITGIVIAISYGFGTIAFPYAHTFFRGPLAALFLICAWYFARQIGLSAAKSESYRSSAVNWLCFTAFSLAGILAKNSIAIAIPVMLLEILIQFTRAGRIKSSKPFWIRLGYGLIVFAIVLGAWILLSPKIPIFARFTPSYYLSLIKFFISNPRPNFLQAMLGPFVSPGKSIFLFSPVLLLSLYSFIFHFRASWSAWLYLFLLIMFQGLFYDADWAGHTNWGLRFVLPAIPQLVFAAAAAFERLIRNNRGILTLIILVLISSLVQLIGVLAPIKQFFISIARAVPQVTYGSTIWQAKNSIHLWGLRWIFQGKPLDQAVWRNPLLLVWLLPAMSLVILLALLYIKRGRFHWFSITALALAICMNVGMLFAVKNDPEYLSHRVDLRDSKETIFAHAQSHDLVLIKSYGTDAWTYWMNWAEDSVQWTALPFHFPSTDQMELYGQTHKPEDALDDITLSILQEGIIKNRKIWLLLPGDTPGADLGLEISWLEANASKGDCEIFSNNLLQTRLCWFDIPH